jgi:hypothetical protein
MRQIFPIYEDPAEHDQRIERQEEPVQIEWDYEFIDRLFERVEKMRREE